MKGAHRLSHEDTQNGTQQPQYVRRRRRTGHNERRRISMAGVSLSLEETQEILARSMVEAVRDGSLRAIDETFIARAWAGIDAANRVFAAAGERTLTEDEFRAAAALAQRLLGAARPGG